MFRERDFPKGKRILRKFFAICLRLNVFFLRRKGRCSFAMPLLFEKQVVPPARRAVRADVVSCHWQHTTFGRKSGPAGGRARPRNIEPDPPPPHVAFPPPSLFGHRKIPCTVQ